MPSKLAIEELQPRPLCQERGSESIVRWCRRYVGMVRPKNRGGVVTLSGFRRSRRAVAYEEILCAGMDKPRRSKVRALPIALQERAARRSTGPPLRSRLALSAARCCASGLRSAAKSAVTDSGQGMWKKFATGWRTKRNPCASRALESLHDVLASPCGLVRNSQPAGLANQSQSIGDTVVQ